MALHELITTGEHWLGKVLRCATSAVDDDGNCTGVVHEIRRQGSEGLFLGVASNERLERLSDSQCVCFGHASIRIFVGFDEVVDGGVDVAANAGVSASTLGWLAENCTGAQSEKCAEIERGTHFVLICFQDWKDRRSILRVRSDCFGGLERV